MKKILVLGVALTCAYANANYIKLPVPADSVASESYRTTKPVQVGYTFTYSNLYQPDPEGLEEYDDKGNIIEPDRNKYGLHVEAHIMMNPRPSRTFPGTRPIVHNDLAKVMKLDEAKIAQHFKGVSKKTDRICEVTGRMMAMFDVHYEEGDNIRFPQLVNATVKSATKIGEPQISCKTYK